jgi:hypothetical protein
MLIMVKPLRIQIAANWIENPDQNQPIAVFYPYAG